MINNNSLKRQYYKYQTVESDDIRDNKKLKKKEASQKKTYLNIVIFNSRSWYSSSEFCSSNNPCNKALGVLFNTIILIIILTSFSIYQ